MIILFSCAAGLHRAVIWYCQVTVMINYDMKRWHFGRIAPSSYWWSGKHDCAKMFDLIGKPGSSVTLSYDLMWLSNSNDNHCYHSPPPAIWRPCIQLRRLVMEQLVLLMFVCWSWVHSMFFLWYKYLYMYICIYQCACVCVLQTKCIIHCSSILVQYFP